MFTMCSWYWMRSKVVVIVTILHFCDHVGLSYTACRPMPMLYNVYFNKSWYVFISYWCVHILYNTLFSREENFAKSEFEIISSRENIFPRKYPPAKIVCLFRQRSSFSLISARWPGTPVAGLTLNLEFASDRRNNGIIAMICVTKSRTGHYACARARGFPCSTMFDRTRTLRRVCRAITR